MENVSGKTGKTRGQLLVLLIISIHSFVSYVGKADEGFD